MRVFLCIFALVLAVKAEKRFRSDKINYIYDKALQHVQDKQRLSKLESELSNYDGVYLDTKDLHGSGKVADLNKALGKLDKKLVTVLEKYGLEETVQSFKEKMKLKNAWEYKEENLELPSEKFADERLQKIWQQAMIGKFSDSEMLELHKELKEVERKMNIYHDSLNEFNKGPHENSVNADHDDHREKVKQLKKANKEMNDHLSEVHKRVTSEEYSPFREEKVKRLWKLAQANSNFTTHDLDILKEELLHFDNQLKKIDFHKKELGTMKEMREKEGKSSLQNIEGAELEARHEKLSRKIRKLEKYLETKSVFRDLELLFSLRPPLGNSLISLCYFHVSLTSMLKEKRRRQVRRLMFDRIVQFTRKRLASEDFPQFGSVDTKENCHQPIEKKMKTTPKQKVCAKCLAGDGGHITHILTDAT
ncbi:unnamed protein product [Caenorhabditis auriculariae]|uniref:Alpha-2-macroglobulin RAP C-terminal domain-containing protein n=1 Tax=Caenorhabditis auriculariae TaxID=2777116 RepID=A0A8S1HVY1_9PELO|nr:unnamed protein product [Caenorhabditis auriculariae]